MRYPCPYCSDLELRDANGICKPCKGVGHVVWPDNRELPSKVSFSIEFSGHNGNRGRFAEFLLPGKIVEVMIDPGSLGGFLRDLAYKELEE